MKEMPMNRSALVVDHSDRLTHVSENVLRQGLDKYGIFRDNVCDVEGGVGVTA